MRKQDLIAMPKENDLEGAQDQGGKHGGQKGMPKPEPRPPQLGPASGDTSEVRFGATVTIVRDDGREQTFRIVGEDEADPAKGSISHVSPLARAMLGKAVGDVITAGKDEAEITSIV
jgi:hypothetical protein